MSRLTTLSQRNPTHSSPSPILYPPSGPSSGRTSPYPNPNPNSNPNVNPNFNGAGGRPSSSASQYSESPYGGGMGSGYTRAAHDVETQNDERLEGLLGKVKSLKDYKIEEGKGHMDGTLISATSQITVGIGNEVRDSNLQLGSMNDAFSSTTNILGGTFRRMNKMASKQGGNWCWFMGFLLLVLWIFVVVWWLRR